MPNWVQLYINKLNIFIFCVCVSLTHTHTQNENNMYFFLANGDVRNSVNAVEALLFEENRVKAGCRQKNLIFFCCGGAAVVLRWRCIAISLNDWPKDY